MEGEGREKKEREENRNHFAYLANSLDSYKIKRDFERKKDRHD